MKNWSELVLSVLKRYPSFERNNCAMDRETRAEGHRFYVLCNTIGNQGSALESADTITPFFFW
jgi:hypothetical protein